MLILCTHLFISFDSFVFHHHWGFFPTSCFITGRKWAEELWFPSKLLSFCLHYKNLRPFANICLDIFQMKGNYRSENTKKKQNLLFTINCALEMSECPTVQNTYLNSRRQWMPWGLSLAWWFSRAIRRQKAVCLLEGKKSALLEIQAKFFIFIPPVMFPDLIQLLKLHTAIFSSVLSDLIVFPGMCQIPENKVLQQGLSVQHLEKKKINGFAF